MDELPEVENEGLNQDAAMLLWNSLVNRGYAVALKHRDGRFTLEIPVRLVGDPAYEQEDEIVQQVRALGREAVQTRDTLTIV
jgi:hypothetical protein